MRWILALHVISVISWMAGLLYLPRLFIYHSGSETGSEMSETFKTMERRLLKAIMGPAMHAAWTFGLILVFWFKAASFTDIWFVCKFVLVLGLTGYHSYLSYFVRQFAKDNRPRNARFFRYLNEVPTVLMIIIVILVIVKPF